MKIIFPLIYLAGASLIFASCQREVDYVVVNRTTNDSIFLDKLILLDTSMAAPADTVERNFFQYDNLRRIKSILSTSDGGGETDSVLHQFFYQATDTLPFMHVYHTAYHFGGGSIFRSADTTYLQYQGELVSKDSVLRWDVITGQNYGAETREFIISGNNVTRQARKYELVSGTYVLISSGTATYTVLHQSGNLIDHRLITGDGYFDFAEFTYDNKRNPIKKVFPVRYPACESHMTPDWINQENNVLTAEVKERVMTVTEQESFTYTYRPDHYPVSATHFDPSFNGYNKLIYLYRTL